VNYQPRLPECKPDKVLSKLDPAQHEILIEDELETRTYASLFRVMERAPIEKRLRIFRLAARFAAAQLEARRQQAIDDLRRVADETGLVRLHGTVMVQNALSDLRGAGQ
jgi:hypothetical protein